MPEQSEDYLKSMENLDDQKIVSLVQKRTKAASDATQTLREVNWPRFFRMYRQELEYDKGYPYRSKIYIPLVFSQVRTLAPYLMETIFSSEPVFKLKDATGQRDDEKQAIEKLIDSQVENNNLYARLNTFILNMLIYGTAVAKVYWEKKSVVEEGTRKVKRIKTQTIAGIKIPVGLEEVEENYSEENVEFDGPVVETIDNLDFLIDPKADRLEGFWKAHITHKTMRQLIQANKAKDGKLYKNLGKLKAQIISGSSEEEGNVGTLKKDQLEKSGITLSSRDFMESKVKLVEYWAPDDKYFYVVAVDQGILIRKSKNVFEHGRSPFIFARFQEIPQEFFGAGVPELIEGLQHNVNTVTNQRNDNINLILNRMWKVKRDSGVNTGSLKSSPGNFIMVDNMDDLDIFETKDVTLSAYQEVLNNKAEAQEALGTKYIAGANPTGSNKTATGVKLNQSAEARTLQGIFRSLEATALKPMVSMFYSLNKQFNDTPSTVAILGPRGQKVDYNIQPPAFGTPRAFYAAGIRNIIERDTRVHQMTNFLAIISREDPQLLLAMGLRKDKIYQRIWEEMGLDAWSEVAGGLEENNAIQQDLTGLQDQQNISQAQAGAVESGLTSALDPSNNVSEGNQGGGVQGTRIQ